MEHPKEKGDRTTLAVMLALQGLGFNVLVPFGEKTRYDLVIEDRTGFARIQCKTGRLRDGSVIFNTVSCYGHHRNPTSCRRDYLGQIDYFAVHCLETGGVYLLPIDAWRPEARESCGSNHRGTTREEASAGRPTSKCLE
jgi:hypothetical protein